MKFVTLFSYLEEIHLVKDVGMIPYVMCEKFGYQGGILCSEQCNIKNNRKDKHFKIMKYKKILGSNNLGACWYLLKNARSIDVLNLYHLNPWNLIDTFLYQLLNPSGIVYLKLDMDYKNLKHFENNIILKKYIKQAIIKKATLISVESTDIEKKLKTILAKNTNLFYMPNGFKQAIENNPTLIEKEKIILTVGRLGTEQKATEILLEAFGALQNAEKWKLYLVGSQENCFSKMMEDFYGKYPNRKRQIEICGEINDRKELFKLYRKASIFVLPSRWESFGIVLIEAQSEGCYIITTDGVPAAFDIVPIIELGVIVRKNQTDELKKALQIAISKKQFDVKKIREHAILNFKWENICRQLDGRIKEERV